MKKTPLEHDSLLTFVLYTLVGEFVKTGFGIFFYVWLPMAFLIGCGEPPPYSIATLVLTGSVSPVHTFGTHSFNLFNLINFSSGLLFGQKSFAAAGSGKPLAVNVTFYRLYASAKDDCSSPVLIHDYGQFGAEKDLSFDPVLFYGKPSETKYKCLAIEMDDSVSFRPDATAVKSFPTACTDTTMEYTSDLYRSDDALAWTNLSGSTVTARGTQLAPITDRIFLFASTSPVRVVNGPPKAQSSQVSQLFIAVEAPTSLVFYADFEDRVSGAGSRCHLKGPTFGFR